jgi:hypothetical protein
VGEVTVYLMGREVGSMEVYKLVGGEGGDRGDLLIVGIKTSGQFHSILVPVAPARLDCYS